MHPSTIIVHSMHSSARASRCLRSSAPLRPAKFPSHFAAIAETVTTASAGGEGAVIELVESIADTAKPLSAYCFFVE